jgi:membrane protein DedA with SNARE-associated domain
VSVILASITSQLTDAVAHHGVLTVAVIMAVDAVLPVGGEITMLFAGALASGALSQHASLFGAQIHDGLAAYVVLALAGTAGYVAGSAAGWLLGIRGGRVLIERYGRRLHLGPERMARAERWFARFGAGAVFVGRLTPLVRSFVSIPAGVLRTPPVSYFAQTVAASLLWCFGFAAAGWALGASYDTLGSTLRLFDYLGASILVAAIILAAVLWRRTRSAPAT